MNLATYIKNLNASTAAWVAEDPANRWSTFLVEDMDFWAEQGITTVEQFVRDGLISTVWDMYKEAHGIRPRHLDLSNWTNEELENEIQSLRDAIKAEAAQWEEEMAYIEECEAKDNEQAKEDQAESEWVNKYQHHYDRLVGS